MYEWTSHHDEIAHYHLRSDLPHPDTHDKEGFMQWVKEVISGSLHSVNIVSLTSSIAALAFHWGLEEAEAKKFALDMSHKLANTSVFATFAGSFWDEYVMHKQQQVNPTVNSARLAANVLRQRAGRV